jgi:hypothetical protein
MAWSFNNLPYGWKIAAGITLAAVTIYVADNQRERVNQADEIELDLAVAERCLATQYSTNPVAYYVAPPSYVRSWYSNSYELRSTTNGTGTNAVITTNWVAVLHTNVFTNAVGYRTDRAKAVARDATIKALIPYYCDTNTVYDGTTNIVMLTVVGLWASLQIGDKTNRFTREPEWIGTNGVTNAATYGELPWRIYKTDLEERYKVLNALKMCYCRIASSVPPINLTPYWEGTYYSGNVEYYSLMSSTWADAISNMTWNLISTNSPQGANSVMYGWKEFGDRMAFIYANGNRSRYYVGKFSTNIPHSVIVSGRSMPYGEFSYQGAISSESNWVEIINVGNSFNEWEVSDYYGSIDFPESCAESFGYYNVSTKGNYAEAVVSTSYYEVVVYTNTETTYFPSGTTANYFTNYPNFQYCTNKYW